MDYVEIAKINSVLADKNRLMIIDMLSCEVVNGNELLKFLPVNQPTLCFHMKKLLDVNLITKSKIGTNNFYALNNETFEKLNLSMKELTTHKKECICKQVHHKEK